MHKYQQHVEGDCSVYLKITHSALHFAPLRSEYKRWTNDLPFEEKGMSWPDWADKHSYAYSQFGNIKTLSSPKSMYRVADSEKILIMLICLRKCADFVVVLVLNPPPKKSS